MLYGKALDDFREAHGLDKSAKPRRKDVIQWLKAQRRDHPYLYALKYKMLDLTLRLPREGMEELEREIRRYCSTNIPPIVPERWYSTDHKDTRRHRRHVVMANLGDMMILKLRFPELQAVERQTDTDDTSDKEAPEPLRPINYKSDRRSGWRRSFHRRLNGGGERDIVYTPEAFARQIIGYLNPKGFVLDPCRGQGAFYNNFPPGVQKDWCEIAQGRNFFWWAKHVDWVLTNPPWSGRAMTAFLEHSLKVADNVALLIPSAMGLTTRKRIRLVHQHGFGLKELIFYDWPEGWPRWAFTLTVHHWQRGWRGDPKFTYFMENEKSRIGRLGR